ncbi:beta-lactamase superfamily domain-containing protein [Penicillium manginii]|uniref:beta-lactamase superfamily domain-containing protein n=1 Tax=Penicillium manginii TaxID=203109 RepID=UPI002548AA96|nr:beta-lactamase superfamily domain-containing protein [Penicillium manginii]KAJ5733034.1 beta-lactamase superfamily domain-containing protein [Penicillium manginii]
MAPTLDITHIGTATAILTINGVNFLTDPFSFPCRNYHEDHPDNLDELGRLLLDGRRVFTTVDGGKNLAPRPAVHGMKPWEEIESKIGGKSFKIMATPTQHVPGNECTGFIVTGEDFGHGRDGLPNAIYFTGDTVYIEELDSIADRFHIVAAVMNLGNAHAPISEDPNAPPYANNHGRQGWGHTLSRYQSRRARSDAL